MRRQEFVGVVRGAAMLPLVARAQQVSASERIALVQRPNPQAPLLNAYHVEHPSRACFRHM